VFHVKHFFPFDGHLRVAVGELRFLPSLPTRTIRPHYLIHLQQPVTPITCIHLISKALNLQRCSCCAPCANGRFFQPGGEFGVQPASLCLHDPHRSVHIYFLRCASSLRCARNETGEGEHFHQTGGQGRRRLHGSGGQSPSRGLHRLSALVSTHPGHLFRSTERAGWICSNHAGWHWLCQCFLVAKSQSTGRASSGTRRPKSFARVSRAQLISIYTSFWTFVS